MVELITLTDIKLGDIVIDVVLKKIKNIHLSVHPPTGRVRISAPSHMSMESIRGTIQFPLMRTFKHFNAACGAASLPALISGATPPLSRRTPFSVR